MKTTLFLLFLTTSTLLSAQPGPDFYTRKLPSRISIVKGYLENDSVNPMLNWERIMHETRNPLDEQPLPDYVVEDLDMLIAEQDSFSDPYRSSHDNVVSLPDLYLKRADCYFFRLKQPDLALEDYKQALERAPDKDFAFQVEERIFDLYFNEHRDQQALAQQEKLVSLHDNRNRGFESDMWRDIEYNEAKKIALLKRLKKNDQLEAYYKFLINAYQLRHQENKGKEKGYWYNYSVDQIKIKAYDLVYELLLHYKHEGDSRKMNKLLDETLKSLPRNAAGDPFEQYTTERLDRFFILQAERCAKSGKKREAWENYLFACGDIFASAKTPDFEREIDGYLSSNPDEGILHFISAIIDARKNYDSEDRAIAEQILEKIYKAEKLGFQDYRIPYLRACIYKNNLKEYRNALEQIDKTIQLNAQNGLIYYQKIKILVEISHQHRNENFQQQFDDLEIRYRKYYTNVNDYILAL